MKSAALSLVGKRFGLLVVAQRAPNRGKRTAWVCKCDCGGESVTLGKYLMSGETTSCGCRKIAALNESRYVHNQFGTPEYWVWAKMLSRCRNPKDKAWPNYGGRGIVVCERWLNFENFWADMGQRPAGMSLDRIDNNGHYEPGNCRWADDVTQRRNKRSSLHVEGVPLVELAKQRNVPYTTAYYRYKKGQTI